MACKANSPLSTKEMDKCPSSPCWKFIDHVQACTCRAPIFLVSYFPLHFLLLSINNALLHI